MDADPSSSGIGGGARNRASYNDIAREWDGARTAFVLRERAYLDALLRGMPPGARVLDLGCGTGRPMAEEVVARGHRVTGVDQAEALLALAAERLPRERWIHARLEGFAFEGTWDAAICWDALFHVPRAHHAALLAGIARSLRPGGRAMLTVGGSAHPAFTDAMFGRTFFYDSHPPAEVLTMLAGLGFRVVVAEFMNRPTGGRERGRYAVVAEMG